MTNRVIFGSLLFLINTGIHWDGSVQYLSIFRDNLGHNTGHPPTTADTSERYRTVMEIDPTMLGS